MVELLVALCILSIAFLLIWNTFSSTLRAWERGGELLDELRHGDFVMEQLVLSLRSAAFFGTAPGVYGFRLDPGGGEYPRDEISWVTSSSSLIPPDSPLANGLFRITVGIEDNDDGDPAVAVRAYPHLAEEEDTRVDPWYISTEVKGLECRTYNAEDEYWENRWEDTNAIPSLVEITLYLDPIEKYGDPVEMKRLVEIPVAAVVTSAVSMAQAPAEEEAGTEGQQPAGSPPPGAAGQGEGGAPAPAQGVTVTPNSLP